MRHKNRLCLAYCGIHMPIMEPILSCVEYRRSDKDATTALPSFLWNHSSITYPGICWWVSSEQAVNHFMTMSSLIDQIVLVPENQVRNTFPLTDWHSCIPEDAISEDYWLCCNKPIIHQIFTREPLHLCGAPLSPFRYHQSSLETREHLLRTFLLNEWKQRQVYLWY